MLTINLDKMASLRVQLTCQKFLKLKREETEVSFDDFRKYYEEAYKLRIPVAGKKTVAEAAFVLCYVWTGWKATRQELINSCAEMLSHPLNDNDCWNNAEADFWSFAEEAAKTFERITEINL